jgi:hypothetical protein
MVSKLFFDSVAGDFCHTIINNDIRKGGRVVVAGIMSEKLLCPATHEQIKSYSLFFRGRIRTKESV